MVMFVFPCGCLLDNPSVVCEIVLQKMPRVYHKGNEYTFYHTNQYVRISGLIKIYIQTKSKICPRRGFFYQFSAGSHEDFELHHLVKLYFQFLITLQLYFIRVTHDR